MKKKIFICSMVIVLLMLVSSTALAFTHEPNDYEPHYWNGHCMKYFTTDEWINYTSDDYNVDVPVFIHQTQCYSESTGYDTRSQIWLVNGSGTQKSAKIILPDEESSDLGGVLPTGTGSLHCRVYNYDLYNEEYMRSIGNFFEY